MAARVERAMRPAVAAAARRPPDATVADDGQAVAKTVLLLLVRWPARSLPWGLSRLMLGARGLGLHRVPGLCFARVLGSGRGGGFGLAPGLDHQGLVCFFADDASARAFVADAPIVRAYRDHARESLCALLRASACRGSWGGVSLAVTASRVDGAPMAALTRASIRARHALRFWRHAPATHAGIAQAPGCRLAVGLGEAPLLRQATFSLWDDAHALQAYARSGAHLAASRCAWQQGWFSESMFVRFTPLSIEGQWHGRRFG